MSDTPAVTVYHYCSLDSLRGMVASRKLWLTNVFFVNDYLEVEWFKALCLDVVREELQALDASPSAKGNVQVAEPVGVGPNGGTQVSDHSFARRRYLEMLGSQLSKKDFDRIFCACFSTVADDLSQWRGYADNARGVCVGLDVKSVVDANSAWPRLDYKEVTYDLDQQRDKAREIVSAHSANLFNDVGKAISQAGTAYASMRVMSPQFKNPKFSSEREVRLLVHDSITGTNLDKSKYDGIVRQQFPSGIEFRARDGALVPYVEIDLPLDAISELWVGPKFGGGLEVSALRLFLNKHGMDLEVRRSQASFR